LFSFSKDYLSGISNMQMTLDRDRPDGFLKTGQFVSLQAVEHPEQGLPRTRKRTGMNRCSDTALEPSHGSALEFGFHVACDQVA
jgi:hypothetical protein